MGCIQSLDKHGTAKVTNDPTTEKTSSVIVEDPVNNKPTDEEKAKITSRRGRARRGSVSAEVPNTTEDSTFIPKVIEKDQQAVLRIIKSVENNFLFANLDDQDKKTVFDAMEEKKTEASEVIIKQGDTGDFFYVVDSGKYSVTINGVDDNKPILFYESGSSFGELALMYNCPRAATVTCDEGGVLWALERQTFRKVVIESMSKKKLRYEHFLEKLPILQNLTSEEKSKLADVLESKEYKDGDEIIKEGDSDFTKMKLYFVEKGKCVATKVDKEGIRVKIGDMGVTSYFGEKALVERNPRAATVSAEGNTVCAFIDVPSFERIMGPCRDIMERYIGTYMDIQDGEKYIGSPISLSPK